MTHRPESFAESVRECARRIRESGAQAVGGLYDLTAIRLVRFSTTITRNQQDAEDAVSAVLLRVVASPGLLSDCQSPWSYLLKMVHNESLQSLRRKKRWSLARGLMDLWTWTRVDAIEQEESIREIWTALRALPAEQSEVVVLKIWEELTFLQIGEVLGIPPATAASRYRYALTKLSLELSSHGLSSHGLSSHEGVFHE